MRNHTYTRSGFGGSASDIVLLGAIAVVAVTGAGTWLTGQVAGLLFDQRWPSVSFPAAVEAAMALPRHLGDPREAWPAGARPDLPGAAGFAVSALLTLLLLGTAAVLGAREWSRRRPRQGFASHARMRQTLSEKAIIKRGPAVRPSLGKGRRIRVEDVGVRAGRADPAGIPLALSIEDSVLLLAAARSGKTSQIIIPWLDGWPGPAFVTSVRPDVLLATAIPRRGKGPVKVMAPTGMTDWPDTLTWDLTSGCGNFNKARVRADVMVTVGKSAEASDSTSSGYFSMSATNLLAGWLHAAALAGGSTSDLLRWAFDERIDEPIRILGSHPGAVEGGAAMVDALYRLPADSTRASLWTTAQTAIAPDARAVFTPPPGRSTDLAAFLREGGTAYMIVDERRASALSPVIAAFADELIETAAAMAASMPGGRLDPPLGMLLDEMGNIVPLPQLPALMSFSGGTGIFICGVLQNMAQARQRWGRDGADMLWGAATVKAILGGLSGPELDDLSRLCGEYRETVIGWQRGQGGSTLSATLQDRRTMTPEQIRTLDTLQREALIIHSSTPVVRTRMTRHYEGPRRDVFAASVAESRRIAGLQAPGAAARPGPPAPGEGDQEREAEQP
jgi:type IV secretory pathway TraG/TraD family ATPase VirD4